VGCVNRQGKPGLLCSGSLSGWPTGLVRVSGVDGDSVPPSATPTSNELRRRVVAKSDAARVGRQALAAAAPGFTKRAHQLRTDVPGGHQPENPPELAAEPRLCDLPPLAILPAAMLYRGSFSAALGR